MQANRGLPRLSPGFQLPAPGGQAATRRGTWRVLDQQSQERALRVPQQEHTEQLEQQHRVSGGGVHRFSRRPVDLVLHGGGTEPQ